MIEDYILAYGFKYNKNILNFDKVNLFRTHDGYPFYASYVIKLNKKLQKLIKNKNTDELFKYIDKVHDEIEQKYPKKINYAHILGRGRNVNIEWQLVYKSKDTFVFDDNFPVDDGVIHDDNNNSGIEFLHLLNKIADDNISGMLKKIADDKNVNVNDILRLLGLDHKIIIVDDYENMEDVIANKNIELEERRKKQPPNLEQQPPNLEQQPPKKELIVKTTKKNKIQKELLIMNEPTKKELIVKITKKKTPKNKEINVEKVKEVVNVEIPINEVSIVKTTKKKIQKNKEINVEKVKEVVNVEIPINEVSIVKTTKKKTQKNVVVDVEIPKNEVVNVEKYKTQHLKI
jgi:hypothetical protein